MLGLNNSRIHQHSVIHARSRCVSRGTLYVLVGNHGPVVVPLPVADRSPGATAMQGDFFVKTRVPAPVMPPQSTTWAAGTFGPPLQQQPPASVTSIPPILSAGIFGPPLQQLGSRPYTFLISGELTSGIRNLLVSPAIIQLVDAQFAEWNRRTRDTNHWSSKSRAVTRDVCIPVLWHISPTRRILHARTRLMLLVHHASRRDLLVC
jgi:hypothetical protein